MKKQKLALKSLQVKSFVTRNSHLVLGGAPTFNPPSGGANYCNSEDTCGGGSGGSTTMGPGIETDQVACLTEYDCG